MNNFLKQYAGALPLAQFGSIGGPVHRLRGVPGETIALAADARRRPQRPAGLVLLLPEQTQQKVRQRQRTLGHGALPHRSRHLPRRRSQELHHHGSVFVTENRFAKKKMGVKILFMQSTPMSLSHKGTCSRCRMKDWRPCRACVPVRGIASSESWASSTRTASRIRRRDSLRFTSWLTKLDTSTSRCDRPALPFSGSVKKKWWFFYNLFHPSPSQFGNVSRQLRKLLSQRRWKMRQTLSISGRFTNLAAFFGFLLHMAIQASSCRRRAEWSAKLSGPRAAPNTSGRPSKRIKRVSKPHFTSLLDPLSRSNSIGRTSCLTQCISNPFECPGGNIVYGAVRLNRIWGWVEGSNAYFDNVFAPPPARPVWTTFRAPSSPTTTTTSTATIRASCGRPTISAVSYWEIAALTPTSVATATFRWASD